MPKAKTKKPNSKPTASAKADPKVQQILDTLQSHWDMGLEISEGKLTVKEFAIENGINERTVRDRRAFYKEYPPEEFENFRTLRFSKSKRPLDSGYVRYLLTIKTPFKKFGKTVADARNGFAKHAAKNDLSPAQLHDLIKRECGRPKSSHGRKYRPRDKATTIEDVVREAVKWIKRCDAAIELVPSDEEADKTLLSLLEHFSQWTSNAAKRFAVSNAVKLCAVSKVITKKSASPAEIMKESLDGILALQSKCLAPLSVKKV